MFKVTNNFAPDFLLIRTNFQKETADCYNIRNNHENLSIPKLNTNFLKCSLAYSGAVAWNSIP